MKFHHRHKQKGENNGRLKTNKWRRQRSRKTEEEIVETYLFSYLAMALLCVLSFFQPTRQRFCISLAFCADFVIHAAIGDSLSDVNYYLCGGLFTLVVLSFVCLLAKPNRFTDLMVAACFGSILLNIYGYYAYDYGLGADIYNNIFLLLYISTIIIFLSRERGDNGDSRHGWFLLPYRKRDNLCYPLHKEAQG